MYILNERIGLWITITTLIHSYSVAMVQKIDGENFDEFNDGFSLKSEIN